MTAEQLWKIEVMVARWKLAAWRERRAALVWLAEGRY